MALAPKLYMTGGLTVKHPVGVRAGLRFRYLGERPAFDESSPEYQYFTAQTLPNGKPNPDYDPARVNRPGLLHPGRLRRLSLALPGGVGRGAEPSQLGVARGAVRQPLVHARRGL